MANKSRKLKKTKIVKGLKTSVATKEVTTKPSKSSKLKVLFKAPFRDYSGYATVARQFILELYKMDKFDLYLEPIVWINSGNLDLDPADKAILDELIKKDKNC